MSINLYFGRAVRELRVGNRLSQEELAEKAGLNRTYFGEVERGVATPSLVTISKIASALSVAPSALIAKSEHLVNTEQARSELKWIIWRPGREVPDWRFVRRGRSR